MDLRAICQSRSQGHDALPCLKPQLLTVCLRLIFNLDKRHLKVDHQHDVIDEVVGMTENNIPILWETINVHAEDHLKTEAQKLKMVNHLHFVSN